MFNKIESILNRIQSMLLFGMNADLTNKAFLEQAIMLWKGSPERMMQIKGHLYYNDEQDIMRRKRMMIGEGGALMPVENLPNNRVTNNMYAKMVDQKTNYLLGKPFVASSENQAFTKALSRVFSRRFMRTLKNAGKAAYNSGIAWLYPCYDAQGEFVFRMFPGYEVLPFWADGDHTALTGAVRLYTVQGFDGLAPKVIEKVEVFDMQGVRRYILDGGVLLPDVTAEEQNAPYVTSGDAALNWTRVPLIAIRCNEQETPLLKRVKSLQDGINAMMSDFENNMQEDARNTILVIKNYDGQDLGEFRKNLATLGAVKVRYDGETKGGVETLEINVNAENYRAILDIFKKALIENAKGYDAKDDRMSGQPNQMNIQSMYSDIDLDANDMETELQLAFEEILWFVRAHLANTGAGSFEQDEVTVVFNRDMMMNESEIIDSLVKLVGVVSDETLIGQIPWVTDPEAELARLKKQRAEEQETYNPLSQDGE